MVGNSTKPPSLKSLLSSSENSKPISAFDKQTLFIAELKSIAIDLPKMTQAQWIAQNATIPINTN